MNDRPSPGGRGKDPSRQRWEGKGARRPQGAEPFTQFAPAGRGLVLAALALFLATLAIRWPGVAMYDSVSQYEQALSGSYGDWHPPIMARTWALLGLIWPGTAPFFVVQSGLWWGGLGLIANALARRGRTIAAAAVLAIGALPLFLGWTTVILKDAQMAACLIAAAGIVAHFRLLDRAMPWPGAAAVAILVGYATLVRGNAVFASVPLALALADWGGAGRWWTRGALLLGGIGLAIALSGPINHRLLGALPSGVERTLPLYDLAGIAHHGGLPTIAGLPVPAWREAERRGCYTPFYWNPYGEPAQCEFVGEALAFDRHGGSIGRDWAGAIVRHPFAYANHRAAHVNANLRFWVNADESDALPPLGSEPNTLGLGSPPGQAARWLDQAAAWQLATPLGWPCVWLAVALGLLWAGRPFGVQARIGCALALSSACMGASFAIVSIASDLRYHLWSMVAAALALVLLVDTGAIDRRRGRQAMAGVALVAAIAGIARLGAAAPVPVPRPAYVPPPPAPPR